MTSPVLAAGPHNTVQETLSIMDKHIVRQVIISSHSAVLGMVSRDDIFEKIHMATVSTAHTAIKGTPVCLINPKAIVYMRDVSTAKLMCPYCESPFDTKDGLSNHIDRLHSGSGVLEGDVRRMFEWANLIIPSRHMDATISSVTSRIPMLHRRIYPMNLWQEQYSYNGWNILTWFLYKKIGLRDMRALCRISSIKHMLVQSISYRFKTS